MSHGNRSPSPSIEDDKDDQTNQTTFQSGFQFGHISRPTSTGGTIRTPPLFTSTTDQSTSQTTPITTPPLTIPTKTIPLKTPPVNPKSSGEQSQNTNTTSGSNQKQAPALKPIPNAAIDIPSVINVYRKLMNIPNLVPIDVNDPDIGAAYTIYGRRATPLGDDDPDYGDYGPALNKRFVKMILSSDELLSELILHKVNAGVFSGTLASPSVPRMIQILSKIRYMMISKQSERANELKIKFHNLSIAELFGSFIPDDMKLPTRAARAALITAVTYGFVNDADLGLPPFEEWYHSDVFGMGTPEDVHNTMMNGDPDIHTCLIILEAWACNMDVAPDMITGVSLFATFVVSMSKRGHVNSRVAKKVADGIQMDTQGEKVNINEHTCKKFYQSYGKFLTSDNSRECFEHLKSIIPHNSIRLLTTIQQATGSGLTTYLVIKRALAKFSLGLNHENGS